MIKNGSSITVLNGLQYKLAKRGDKEMKINNIKKHQFERTENLRVLENLIVIHNCKNQRTKSNV